MINRLITMAALAVGGVYVAKQMKKRKAGASTVRESIVVDVPVRTAYDQWTQFEEFPSFMDSVHEVRQLDNKRLHWKADVLGKPVEWDAEIVEQIPDKRIAWRSTTGAPNSGVVTFEPQAGSRCRVTLQMTYEPQDAIENIGDLLGAVRLEASSNLKRFKEMIEKRGKETGAWRGTIQSQGPSPTAH
ncbi:SRPBCC family protein [Pseudoduganella sp. LjRoot289]|uniref:SRPBCC family protein n=1 Tax=Pseudoduganella sp. LjRoot289 TaxID=3342314 RepID=UPI003ECC526A